MSEKVIASPAPTGDTTVLAPIPIKEEVDKCIDFAPVHTETDSSGTEKPAEPATSIPSLNVPLRPRRYKSDCGRWFDYTKYVESEIMSEYQGFSTEKLKSIYESNRLTVNGIENGGLRMNMYEACDDRYRDWLHVEFPDINKTVKFSLQHHFLIHEIFSNELESFTYCGDEVCDDTVSTMDEVVSALASIENESNVRYIVRYMVGKIVHQPDNQAQLFYNHVLLRMIVEEDGKKELEPLV